MTGRSQRSTFVLALALLGAVARNARAADEIDPLAVHVAFSATGDTCPTRDVFIEAVRARTNHVRLDAPEPNATAIEVRAFATDSGWRGDLSMREADQTTEVRTLEGASCAEVVTGLALIASLLLADEATARAQKKPLARESSAPEARPSAPAPTPAPPARPRTTELGAGVSAGALAGVGPGLAPSLGLFGEASLGAGRWFHPSFRLLLEGAFASRGVETGSHDYLLVQGVLRACPLRAAVDRFAFGPCLGMAAGAHRGRATGVVNAADEVFLWLAPSASVFGAVSLGRGVKLELEGGVAAPLRRTRFLLAPARVLHETPAIAPFARVSLGVARFL